MNVVLRLAEAAVEFLWVGGVVGWGLQSHIRVQPNNCVKGCVMLCCCWGCDNIEPNNEPNIEPNNEPNPILKPNIKTQY